MKKVLLFITIGLVSFLGFSQIPSGYYDSAQGLTGDALREELHQIIKGHTVVTYKSLKTTHHESTDKKVDGTVWDMYSDVPGGTSPYTFTFIDADKCGNYSGEGDCFNREHSFPQSWYGSNDNSPMYSDLFHVYPTDGYVNGQRASLPFGEVSTANWTSQNGSKRGPSATAGYSGTVFEPIDEYKGDFARSYFYVVTRYKDVIVPDSWPSEMLTGDNLSSWAIDLMLDWDTSDPVSQKEIDRNNAVHDIQNNRNPYIDDPQYVSNIWGDGTPVDTTSPGDTVVNSIAQHLIKSVDINYSNGVIHVNNLSKVSTELTILSILGNKVSSYTLKDAKENIPLKLQSGIYIAVIEGRGKKFIVK